MTEEEIAAGLREKYGDEIELPKDIQMGGVMIVNDPPQQSPEERARYDRDRVAEFLLNRQALEAHVRELEAKLSAAIDELVETEADAARMKSAHDADRKAWERARDQLKENAIASELVNFDSRRAEAEANLRYEWAANVNKEFDYRYLLYLYMRHVGEQEGIDFVLFHDNPNFMNGKQWDELHRLAELA